MSFLLDVLINLAEFRKTMAAFTVNTSCLMPVLTCSRASFEVHKILHTIHLHRRRKRGGGQRGLGPPII